MARLWFPRIHAKKVLHCYYSRRVNTELHDSKCTPWSLKRAPAIGLKKEGEMLFLQKCCSLSPPTGHNREPQVFVWFAGMYH